ncbi:Ferritin-like catalase Nec2 [Ancistrocladus abbreviatus]
MHSILEMALNSFPCSLAVLALLLSIATLAEADASDPYDHYNDASNPKCQSPYPPDVLPIYQEDIDLLQFAQNIEHAEADFFLWGALGYGLDKVAPELVMGGPPPVGVKKANLDSFTESIIREFAYEEVGHLRILKSTVGGIPRPFMNLSAANFARYVDEAFGYRMKPPFDPYRDSLSYMMASYIIPYIGLTGYVGANPMIKGYVTKRLTAGLLGVEAGQDAVIRLYLYERAKEIVHPYNYTVAEFTVRLSELRNRLGMCGLKDEGVVVPPELGAEGRSSTNVLSANRDSISYSRTPAEILRIMYDTGNEHLPGGFYPKGGNGKIARQYLGKTHG